MNLMSNYSKGFNGGVLVRNHPVADAAPGKVFWVGNSATLLVGEKSASNGNDGSFLRPFSTIDYAIGQCAANRGDVIYVRPNHTTTATAADTIDLDVAGVSLIGLGNGENRPRIDFTGASGEVSVGADNVLIDNFNFHANVTTVTLAIDIEDGVDFTTIKNCLFDTQDTGTDEFTNAIRITNNNTGFVIRDCYFDMGIGAAARAIYLDADTDNGMIVDNVIQGDFSTACIGGDTTLSTNLIIENNILINGSSNDLGTVAVISLLTGTSGYIRNNLCVCNVATPDLSIVADTCILSGNRYSETIAGADSELYTPSLIDDAANILGVDDSNNAFASTNVASNRDGSLIERLEHLNAGNVLGETFIVKKTLTSSAIVTAGVDVTGTASGGDVMIEDIIFETNATGLAAGTNFTVEKDGGSGVLTFFSETVANLGANKTEVMSTGSVVSSSGTVLESGQKLVAKCTAADCTGAGTITLYLRCRRVADSATVAAA